MKNPKRGKVLALVAMLAVTLFGVVAYQFTPPVVAQTRRLAVEQRIANTVREYGEVEAVSSVEIRNQIPGQTAILFVAREGMQVKKGDLLVRMDSSKIETAITAQRLVTNTASADMYRSQKRLAKAESQQNDLQRMLKLSVDSAKLETAELLGDDGELALESKEAEGEVRILAAKLRVVKAKVAAWKAENGDKQLPAELELELVETEVNLKRTERLQKFINEVKRPKAKLALSLKQGLAQFELQQKLAGLELNLVDIKAELAQTTLVHKEAVAKLTQLEDQLAQCEIRAPKDGTVIYANQRSTRGAAEFVVELGALVRQNQTIIRLPDMTRLQIRALVNETRIGRVRVGQDVEVELDALRGQKIKGKVTRVARNAEPTSWFSSQVKEYAVNVELAQPPANIRLGMTAYVEIQAGRNMAPSRSRSSTPPSRTRSGGAPKTRTGGPTRGASTSNTPAK